MADSGDNAFIERTTIGSAGTAVAVKDIIDLVGLPTTAGCRALERSSSPATADADCMAGLRAAIETGEARVVGKTNLSELAMGASGVNEWFGTPHNPLDPTLIPGGSSSGSAVAVATGEAEVGIGTDTGGSVRVPAACCGIVGLKTTHGRVPTQGVLPLAESLDSVGPLGRDVAAAVRGMELLEPGFAPAAPARVVGRVRVPAVDPTIEAAVDREPGLVLQRTRDAIALGRELSVREEEGRRFQRGWEAELAVALGQAELLAWPTLAGFPPRLEDFAKIDEIARCMEVNLAGLPALAQPVPTPGPLPASLQLVGPAGSEERLVATGAVIEAANGTG